MTEMREGERVGKLLEWNAAVLSQYCCLLLKFSSSLLVHNTMSLLMKSYC